MDVPMRLVLWLLLLVHPGIVLAETVTCQDGTQLIDPDTSVIASVPQKYWKCGDTNADGITDAIVAMTQVEQDALDQQNAQALTDEQLRQSEFNTEITTNDLCSSGLS